MSDQESRLVPKQRATHSGLELAGEVSDLAVGAGILTFALAPLALRALALAVLAAVALLIPVLAGAVLAAPILAVRRWRRTPARSNAVDTPARRAAPALMLGGRSWVTHGVREVR